MSKANSLENLLETELLWQASSQSVDRTTRGVIPIKVSFGVKEIDSVLPGGCILPGSTHEFTDESEARTSSSCALLFGTLARTAVASFIASTDARWSNKLSFPYYILFIGKVGISPFVLNDLLTFEHEGVHSSFLHRVLFLRPSTESLLLWSIETALRSTAVALVVSECPHISLAVSKRFAMAAKSGNSIGLFLKSSCKADVTAAVSRWHIKPVATQQTTPVWNLELLKVKGTFPEKHSWLVNVVEDYAERKTVPLTLFSDMVSGSSEKTAPPASERFAA